VLTLLSPPPQPVDKIMESNNPQSTSRGTRFLVRAGHGMSISVASDTVNSAVYGALVEWLFDKWSVAKAGAVIVSVGAAELRAWCDRAWSEGTTWSRR
jgi:hypothetical protein